MKIMIVDEDKNFRNYLKAMINAHNDQCIELIDALYLNEDYENYRPGLVVIDLQMKKINGFTAAGKLLKEFPEARIAVLSSFEDGPLRAKAERMGIKNFIPKEYLFEFYEIISSDENDLIKNNDSLIN